jgi:hypothetical protein
VPWFAIRGSPDGKHIAWSERHPDKAYEIKLADFVEAPEPHLGNIRSYSPDGERLSTADRGNRLDQPSRRLYAGRRARQAGEANRTRPGGAFRLRLTSPSSGWSERATLAGSVILGAVAVEFFEIPGGIMNTSHSGKLDRIVAEARRAAETRDRGYREQALKLYPWICGRCAREFTRANLRELTVHHRDHNHDHNPPDGSNWELLCLYCHDNEHQRQVHATGAGGSSPIADPASTYASFADLKELLAKNQAPK